MARLSVSVVRRLFARELASGQPSDPRRGTGWEQTKEQIAHARILPDQHACAPGL
jgi:hypothetical protein